MKLTHCAIPEEILAALPRGIRHTVRQGKDFLVVEQLFCPEGHSLMVDHVRIHGQPSISLMLRVGDTSGMIYLDPFWGSHDKLYNFVPDLAARAAPDNTALCPVCACDLRQPPACPLCHSDQVFAMFLPGGSNRILACATLGCHWHKLQCADLSDQAAAMIDDLNFFGL